MENIRKTISNTTVAGKHTAATLKTEYDYFKLITHSTVQ